MGVPTHLGMQSKSLSARDSLGYSPHGVAFVLTRASWVWAPIQGPEHQPRSRLIPGQAVGHACKRLPCSLPLLCSQVNCSSLSISCFLFLVAQLTIPAWLLVATHPWNMSISQRTWLPKNTSGCFSVMILKLYQRTDQHCLLVLQQPAMGQACLNSLLSRPRELEQSHRSSPLSPADPHCQTHLWLLPCFPSFSVTSVFLNY